jgi:hypothetical protein
LRKINRDESFHQKISKNQCQLSGGSNGSDDEAAFNDNASVISNVSSGSFARDDCATSGDDTAEELSQVCGFN